jgi:hypothetical protein
MVRPYLAAGALEFLSVVWPALLLLAAHYWWVIRSDVSFEEASVEASRKVAETIAARHAGKRQRVDDARDDQHRRNEVPHWTAMLAEPGPGVLSTTVSPSPRRP